MLKIACALAALCGAPTLSYATCWEDAGQRYGVEPALLKAIAWEESRGWTSAVGPKLPDGNRAIGLMQINTVHLPRLKEYGITERDLFDACVSQQVGAWILADCIRQFGNTWKAVGCYCAGPASKNVQAQVTYVLDVQRFYEGYKRQEMLQTSNTSTPTGLTGEPTTPRE